MAEKSSSSRVHARRGFRSSRLAVVLAVLVGLAVTGVAVATTGVLSPGDVIQSSGEPAPPPQDDLGVDETVLATGSTETAGPWRLTAYTSKDSDGRELPCVRIALSTPPEGTVLAGSGFCGKPGHSGVSAASLPIKGANGTELIVFGLAPPAAASVQLVDDGGNTVHADATPSAADTVASDVWVMTIPDRIANGRLEWVNASGKSTPVSVRTSGFFDRREMIEKLGSN